MCLKRQLEGQTPHQSHPYRPFFITAIFLLLTTGVGWGVVFLWQIAASGKVTGVSLPHINAHGHTLIYGFLLMFILGFAYQSFPRLWGAPLQWPAARPAVFLGLTSGIGLMVAAQLMLSPALAVAAGILETLEVVLFTTQMRRTYLASARQPTQDRTATRPAASTIIMFISMAFLCLHTPLGASLSVMQLASESRYEMIHITSIYQPAVRYLEYHGTVLLMIVAVGSRLLPAFYNIPPASDRKLLIVASTIALAALIEAGLFVTFRQLEDNRIASLLLLPWLALLTATLALVLPWKPWKPLRDRQGRTDRVGKFVRTAWIWLIASVLFTIALPFWSMATGTAFSHAFHSAVRQSFTVGFATLMVMGFAAKVIPNLSGVLPNRLPSLLTSFLLVNVGLLIHVGASIASDLAPGALRLLPLAGVLQFLGVSLWAANMLSCIVSGFRQQPTITSTSRVSLSVIQTS
jgi:hypothetical protein